MRIKTYWHSYIYRDWDMTATMGEHDARFVLGMAKTTYALVLSG
jgi:hypothetical protein